MNRLIFGCGYLGSRIAKIWHAQGDTVNVVTRNPDRAEAFRKLGYSPFIADITDSNSLNASQLNKLSDIDTVLFAVGMDRSRYKDVHDVYVGGLQNALSIIQPPRHFIYVSSTGVYGNFDGDWVDETSKTEPSREGGKACLAAERFLNQDPIWAERSTILRFAGIYGPDRVPTRSLIESNDWKKLSAAGFLNLIHVDDGATLTTMIANIALERSLTSQSANELMQTFCVSDGNPVLRKKYYEEVAKILKLDQIPWEECRDDTSQTRSGSNKRVANKLLTSTLGGRLPLRFPTYREGLAHAISVSNELEVDSEPS